MCLLLVELNLLCSSQYNTIGFFDLLDKIKIYWVLLIYTCTSLLITTNTVQLVI